MTLVRAADAAFPPDLSTLADDVKVVLGYVGQPGFTPHVWTRSQVDAVRASGRQWWAIWVPMQGSMSAQTGRNAARGMIAALPFYDHPKSAPVFFDVEYSSYEADGNGARAAVDAFVADMRAAGYFQAHGYVPAAMGSGWFANWTGEAPSELPAGTVGQQYLGDYHGWDYSVFDKRLYDNDPQPDPAPGPGPDPDSGKDLLDMIKYVEIYVTHGGHIYAAQLLAGTYMQAPDQSALDARQIALTNAGLPWQNGGPVDGLRRYGREVEWAGLS